MNRVLRLSACAHVSIGGFAQSGPVKDQGAIHKRNAVASLAIIV